MALETRDLNLFGLDLARLARDWKAGWQELLALPALACLSPPQAVRLCRADGESRICRDLSFEPWPSASDARFCALCLPDALVLSQRLTMPDLSRDEMRQAAALAVATASPFAPEDTVWGWSVARRPDGKQTLSLALASRSQIEAWRQSAPQLAALPANSEVWAEVEGRPVLIEGFGESARLKRVQRERQQVFAMLALILMLILALAVLPFLQLRARVFEAQASFADLQARTAETVAARDALIRANDRIVQLRGALATRPDLPAVLEQLARLLPDDAYLTRFEIDGRHVRIIGQAANASSLMELIGAQPGFRDVRAPSPISRIPATGKEAFSLEFNLAEDKTP